MIFFPFLFWFVMRADARGEFIGDDRPVAFTIDHSGRGAGPGAFFIFFTIIMDFANSGSTMRHFHSSSRQHCSVGHGQINQARWNGTSGAHLPSWALPQAAYTILVLISSNTSLVK